jgi:hypothetical protein
MMYFDLVAKLYLPNVIHAFLVDYGIKSKNNIITYNLTNVHLCSTFPLPDILQRLTSLMEDWQ